jgi:hypothetical protein
VEVSLSFFFSKGFFEFQYVGKGDGWGFVPMQL